MIPITRPSVGEEELQEIRKVLESGCLTQGPKVAEFEDAIKKITGARHAFAMSSATTALHLSLVVTGIRANDEVLVSDFTYPATGNVIVQQGAIPVCVDVLPDTYAMDPEDLEARITSRSRAIMVVHPFGLSADMDPILAIANRHGLPVIEDAACALGATYKGKHCGTMGRLGCFSFHPRKSITTGEGGMIVTDDDGLAESIACLRSHGGIRKQFYQEFTEFGFNYRMSDVSAALGVAQTRRLEWILQERRRSAQNLIRSVAKLLPLFTFQIEPPNQKHTWQSLVANVSFTFDRDHLISYLRSRNIEATLGTYAMHAQPSFKRFGYKCPTSRQLQSNTITVPNFPTIAQSEIESISKELKAFCDSYDK